MMHHLELEAKRMLERESELQAKLHRIQDNAVAMQSKYEEEVNKVAAFASHSIHTAAMSCPDVPFCHIKTY